MQLKTEVSQCASAHLLQGKRVLVTGADGFIGSHLTEVLHRAGAKVIPFVRNRSMSNTAKPTFQRIILPASEFEDVEWGDVGSPDVIGRLTALRPDYVFHLAADAFVDHSFSHPQAVFHTNAVGTQYILEAARLLPTLQRIVVFSSSEVYGSSAGGAMSEDHPLNPTSPYAASKAAADRLAYSYYCTYGLPVIIMRPFNCFGPRHTYDVIPKFIRLALEGRPLTIYGDGSQARDFTYVKDTIRGAILCATAEGIEGQAFNIGSGRAVSVSELAESIHRMTGGRSPIVRTEARKAEVSLLLADSQKAHRLLGWQPEYAFEDALSENIAWEAQRVL